MSVTKGQRVASPIMCMNYLLSLEGIHDPILVREKKKLMQQLCCFFIFRKRNKTGKVHLSRTHVYDRGTAASGKTDRPDTWAQFLAGV